METHRARNRTLDWILSVVFLALIFVPWVDTMFGLGIDPSQSTEKRKLARKPVLAFDSVNAFPAMYERYFNDHFAFRNLLIRVNSLVSSELFDISAVSDVLIGREGWLYYVAPSQGNSLADHVGLICLDETRLELIRASLERRKRILDSMGIRSLVVIAPDKHSIYPEFLPSKIKRRGRCPSRLQQVIDYLNKKSSARILDLRHTLVQAKDTSSHYLYMQTDSHWNAFGGYLAYREIVKELGLSPIAPENFVFKEEEKMGGDLAGELSIPGRLTEKRAVSMSTPLSSTLSDGVRSDYDVVLHGVPAVINNANGKLPTLFFFRDSFGAELLNYLPYHFSKTTTLQTHQFFPQLFAAEKPDYVIFEIVERGVIFLVD
jgi:alginate O-acetyltransferase complex protein AlgJ